MPVNYEKLRASIGKAIRTAGLRVALERPGAPSGNPWSPIPATPVYEPLTAVIGGLRQGDAGSTLAGRVTGTVTAAAEAGMAPPDKGHRLLLPPGEVTVTTSAGEVTGSWFDIIDVEPIAPAGIPVGWTLTVAR